jgi:hypothetical protein
VESTAWPQQQNISESTALALRHKRRSIHSKGIEQPLPKNSGGSAMCAGHRYFFWGAIAKYPVSEIRINSRQNALTS